MQVNTQFLAKLFTDWRILLNGGAALLNFFVGIFNGTSMAYVNFSFMCLSIGVVIWIAGLIHKEFKREEFEYNALYDITPKETEEVQPEVIPETKQVYCTVKD